MFEYQAPANFLQDRVVLVTGAGDGIGKAAAKAYARHGATVILLGRTTSKLEKVYDEIESEGGSQPAIIPLNLETATAHDYEEVATMIDREFGKLDGLLHNASLLGRMGPLFQYDPDTWQQVMQVNVHAEFLMTRALLPLLRAAPSASVIFTSSGVGNKGRAHWGAYSVSKFATEGLMQVLADEEDGLSNVRSNAINPGGTRTNMRALAYPGEDPDTLKTPEDIIPVYLYLMGDDSREVNGQRFNAQ
ncbi:YciK family oxidoreductase [Sansalvadorimonas sp. 2012CJ34-2]|uniref:YciK family oxidoreductase n=1 Tax=Parendozoicomonas callyspongiae TaxID=2942213 RepID=A0ABT0PJ10_9GAMM|nr:YciK family oxidoreductase [Sansalvadorimonas sp. 2012CJ34-2]MCL6271313.1 YciK family oxidoreductase [Sansalvadorimonas sp. 2012CJ34-2]